MKPPEESETCSRCICILDAIFFSSLLLFIFYCRLFACVGERETQTVGRKTLLEGIGHFFFFFLVFSCKILGVKIKICCCTRYFLENFYDIDQKCVQLVMNAFLAGTQTQ